MDPKTLKKEVFLDEIKDLKLRGKKEWLILGDFNLICKAEDKSNNRLNRRIMTQLKETLDEAQLMEVDLRGRAYMWSNEQNEPTFTRIDRVFGSPEWHLLFPNIDLHALSTLGSDHAPLLLTGDVKRQNYSGFCFESFWANMPGFLETVQTAWAQLVNTQDSILRMHVKLIRTAKALKLWRRQSLGNLPLRLEIAKQLLPLMDTEQEKRPLSQDELVFRRYLKAELVNLAVVQRSRARQHSRLTWIRNGDACTKLFMLHTSNRRRKLFIPSMKLNRGLEISQQRKEETVYDHFVNLLGQTQSRSASLNWAHLGYEQYGLHEL
jgi:hypothetical protein